MGSTPSKNVQNAVRYLKAHAPVITAIDVAKDFHIHVTSIYRNAEYKKWRSKLKAKSDSANHGG